MEPNFDDLESRMRQYQEIKEQVGRQLETYGLTLEDLRGKNVLQIGIGLKRSELLADEYDFNEEFGTSEPLGQYPKENFDLILDNGGVDYLVGRKGEIYTELLNEILALLKKSGQYRRMMALSDEEVFNLLAIPENSREVTIGDYKAATKIFATDIRKLLAAKASNIKVTGTVMADLGGSHYVNILLIFEKI